MLLFSWVLLSIGYQLLSCMYNHVNLCVTNWTNVLETRRLSSTTLVAFLRRSKVYLMSVAMPMNLEVARQQFRNLLTNAMPLYLDRKMASRTCSMLLYVYRKMASRMCSMLLYLYRKMASRMCSMLLYLFRKMASRTCSMLLYLDRNMASRTCSMPLYLLRNMASRTCSMPL